MNLRKTKDFPFTEYVTCRYRSLYPQRMIFNVPQRALNGRSDVFDSIILSKSAPTLLTPLTPLLLRYPRCSSDPTLRTKVDQIKSSDPDANMKIINTLNITKYFFTLLLLAQARCDEGAGPISGEPDARWRRQRRGVRWIKIIKPKLSERSHLLNPNVRASSASTPTSGSRLLLGALRARPPAKPASWNFACCVGLFK